jgi:hypothetical protein
LVDGKGTPLAVRITAANRNESLEAMNLVDDIPPIRGRRGRPRTPHGSGLGQIRWVVERSLAWVGQARRLKVRYDKLPSSHRAFHFLQLARICCTILQRDFC